MQRTARPHPAHNPGARSRVVTWDDPGAAFQQGARAAGREYLSAIASGALPAPPIARLMGFEIVSVEEGRVVLAAVPAEFHYNPIGVVHGGLAATLLDSAMSSAVHSTLPAGTAYTTLELKVNFVRPITVDTGRIVCEGDVLHRGSTVATAQGRLVAEGTGKLLAHGVTTCMLLEGRAG